MKEPRKKYKEIQEGQSKKEFVIKSANPGVQKRRLKK